MTSKATDLRNGLELKMPRKSRLVAIIRTKPNGDAS
jgi:hypothetical protein